MLQEAVKTDKLTRMDMLFAKHCSPQTASDLIHSKGLEDLLNQAREAYDYVVIDLPPMAIVPDPEAVMEYADGSLLVIRQNVADASAINRSVAALENGKAKLFPIRWRLFFVHRLRPLAYKLFG